MGIRIPFRMAVARLAGNINTSVRGSIWLGDFIVGAGDPAGLSEPWAKSDEATAKTPAPTSKRFLGRF